MQDIEKGNRMQFVLSKNTESSPNQDFEVPVK